MFQLNFSPGLALTLIKGSGLRVVGTDQYIKADNGWSAVILTLAPVLELATVKL